MKALYYIRMIFNLLGLFLTFMLIQNITQVGLAGYLYLVIYLLFSLMTIKEVLSQKAIYKKDLVYNLMQIGFTFYLGIIVFKTYHDKIVVMENTIKYFDINYLILSVLLAIISSYKFWDVYTQR